MILIPTALFICVERLATRDASAVTVDSPERSSGRDIGDCLGALARVGSRGGGARSIFPRSRPGCDLSTAGRAPRGQPAAVDRAARPRGEPTIELGVRGSHQNAPPATSARATPGERAKADAPRQTPILRPLDLSGLSTVTADASLVAAATGE